jgi:hypothetical protein
MVFLNAIAELFETAIIARKMQANKKLTNMKKDPISFKNPKTSSNPISLDKWL